MNILNWIVIAESFLLIAVSYYSCSTAREMCHYSRMLEAIYDARLASRDARIDELEAQLSEAHHA